MKISIFSRTILAMLLTTFAATHAAEGGGSSSSAPGSGGSTPRLTITSPKLFRALEVVVASLALLAPRKKMMHTLSFQAVLGAVVYLATLRGGNYELANKFAGHVGLATIIILVCRTLKSPIEFLVPVITYYLLHRKIGTEKLRSWIAMAPQFITKLASRGLSQSQINRATIAAYMAGLRGSGSGSSSGDTK